MSWMAVVLVIWLVLNFLLVLGNYSTKSNETNLIHLLVALVIYPVLIYFVVAISN